MSTLFDNTDDRPPVGEQNLAPSSGETNAEVKQAPPAGNRMIGDAHNATALLNTLLAAYNVGATYQLQHAGFFASSWTVSQPLTAKKIEDIMTDTSITNIRILINVTV